MNSYQAKLESRLDYLETEMSQLNQMLISCGFPKGIQTLKESVLELLNQDLEIES